MRRIEERDTPFIQKILSDTRGGLGSPHWTPEQVAEECRGLGFVDVDRNGEPLAFVLIRDTGSAWEITFLATALEVRRQGRMERLLAEVFSNRPQGHELWLEVHEGNESARRLYGKLGFREVGRRPRYYSDGGTAVLYNYG